MEKFHVKTDIRENWLNRRVREAGLHAHKGTVFIKIWNLMKILFIEHHNELSKGQFYKGKITRGEKTQFWV